MAHKHMSMIGRNAYLVVFVILCAFLTTTTAQAGFEWVPSDAEPPVIADQDEALHPSQPVAPAAQNTLMPEPLLQSEALPAPVTIATPEEQSVPQTTVQNLADQAPTSHTPEHVEPKKLKILELDQPDQTTKPAPIADDVSENEPQALVPPPVKAPAGYAPPPGSKLIVPQDAPQSAISSTDKPVQVLIDPNASNNNAVVDGEPVAPPKTDNAIVVHTETTPVFAEAVGFGSDMPLAIALQQVVPSEYAFSFGADVNPGQRVSWNGGKPWNQVVLEMIAPLDLEANISGRVVHIHTSKSSNQSSATDMPTPEATEAVIHAEMGTTAVVEEMPHNANFTSEAQNQEISSLPAQEASSEEANNFHALKGDSLKDTLTAWSSEAGIELIWQASHDYTISADFQIDSSFETAVQDLFSSALNIENKPSLSFLGDIYTQDVKALMIGKAT
jgi:hypothetical protein